MFKLISLKLTIFACLVQFEKGEIFEFNIWWIFSDFFSLGRQLELKAWAFFNVVSFATSKTLQIS